MGRVIYEEDIINSFIKDCKIRKFAEHTIESYMSVLRGFTSFLHKTVILSLSLYELHHLLLFY